LKPLPKKAIWVAVQNRIFQGKLDIKSLRAITGQIDAKLVCFVEDSFAKEWVEAMLRQTNGVSIDSIQVHAMEGDGIAVAINRNHNKDPSITVPSICYIDGDSKQIESDEHKTYRLPGESPEAYIFDKVLEVWSVIGGKLCVALLQRFEDTDRIKHVCKDIRMLCMDSHLLFSQIGERLGLVPEETVAAAFVNIWAQAYPDIVNIILDPVRDVLPNESD